jgi:exodeoxyribonuclease VIII
MSSDKVHIMVDIETLDTNLSAVILSIGAVTMHREDQQTFYGEYNPDTQSGRTQSQSTLAWWAQQTIQQPKGVINLYTGLEEFSYWLHSLRAEPIIWCKGTDFDTVILSNAYQQYKLPVPWKYNNVRDMRTLKKLHPQLNYLTNPVPHHALQDAINQATHLAQIFAYNQYLQWE